MTSSAEQLTQEQERKMDLLLNITGLDDVGRRRALLVAHGWNLDDAVLDFLGETLPPEEDQTHGGTNVAAAYSRRADADQDLGGLAGLAQSVISAILAPVRYLANAPAQTNAHENAKIFAKTFGAKYGRTPSFCPRPYRDALKLAADENRMLIIYLNSSQHPDAGPFCKDVLSTAPFAAAVSECLVWGAEVETAEGYCAMEALQVATFPFLAAVVSNKSGSSVQIVVRIEGNASARTTLTALGKAKNYHATIVRQAEQRTSEAVQRRIIREQQDEALAASIEADRRRSEEVARAKEEGKRKALEEANRAQSRVNDIESKRARLSPEPPKSKSTASLRIQFPDGSRFQRRFEGAEELARVWDAVDVHIYDSSIEIENYTLSTNFPRMTYTKDESASETLVGVGLCPQAVLFVNDLDA